MKQMRALARRAIFSMGLQRRWYVFRAWLRPSGSDAWPAVDDNGVPIPPRALVNLVVGDLGWRTFLTSGEEQLRIIADAIDSNGGNFKTAAQILDFGCGCGRLTRHISKLSDAKIMGVDYNQALADWCATNLVGDFSRNGLRPPLQLPAGSVDVAYLLSVFTHLHIDTQNEWLAELRRTTKPGGFVLITFHDEAHPNLVASGMTGEQLCREGTLIHNDAAEGSNFIGTFQSREFTRQQFGKFFDVAEITPSLESGLGQAIAVLRRRD